MQQIPAAQRLEQVSQSEEMRRLKVEFKRVTEVRDISILRSEVRLKYTFIAKHLSICSEVRLCRVLRLHPSGYYA